MVFCASLMEAADHKALLRVSRACSQTDLEKNGSGARWKKLEKQESLPGTNRQKGWRRVSKPRPRARAWGRSRRQASAIYPERRRRRTLAGNRHVSGALRRRLLAAAAARAKGWRRPQRGFTGWSTLRADAPLARNAARVSPRTRSAWPSWCRCGGAGPGA